MTVAQDSDVAAAAVLFYQEWTFISREIERQKKVLHSFKVIFNWLLQEWSEL